MDYPKGIVIFLEFYGLPGCGKSTVSHTVAKLLREKGYTVEEPSFDIDHQRSLFKLPQKLFIACFWLIIHNKEFRSIRNVVKRNGYEGMGALKQTVNVVQKIRTYNQNAGTQICIWDQGLVQACISLSVNGKVSAEDNYASLIPLIKRNIKIVPVFMPVEIDVALKRVNERPSNDSRVEKLARQEQKKDMLMQFQKGIDSIQNTITGKNVVVEDLENLADKVSVTLQKVLGAIK
jgi:shikimate kinase